MANFKLEQRKRSTVRYVDWSRSVADIVKLTGLSEAEAKRLRDRFFAAFPAANPKSESKSHGDERK